MALSYCYRPLVRDLPRFRHATLFMDSEFGYSPVDLLELAILILSMSRACPIQCMVISILVDMKSRRRIKCVCERIHVLDQDEQLGLRQQ